MTDPLSVDAPVLVDARRAAELLGGISPRHLWSLTAPRGPVPSIKLGGRVLYSVAALRSFVESKMTRQNKPSA